MESGLIWIVALFVVGMGFSLWALLAPDTWMRIGRLSWGWMFRGGRDAELSDSGRVWIRIRGVIGIIATLVACGMLLGLRAESIARVDAAEQQQATDERLRAAAGAWGANGGSLRIALPTGGAPDGTITPEEIPATIVGFAPVTDDGSAPSYLRDLPVFRSTLDLVTRDDDREEIYRTTDLVIGTHSPCEVSAVVVTPEDDRVVLEVVYAATVAYNFSLTCTTRSIGTADLVPIDLDEPLGDRVVELADGTRLPEITEP